MSKLSRAVDQSKQDVTLAFGAPVVIWQCVYPLACCMGRYPHAYLIYRVCEREPSHTTAQDIALYNAWAPPEKGSVTGWRNKGVQCSSRTNPKPRKAATVTGVRSRRRRRRRRRRTRHRPQRHRRRRSARIARHDRGRFQSYGRVWGHEGVVVGLHVKWRWTILRSYDPPAFV